MKCLKSPNSFEVLSLFTASSLDLTYLYPRHNLLPLPPTVPNHVLIFVDNVFSLVSVLKSGFNSSSVSHVTIFLLCFLHSFTRELINSTMAFAFFRVTTQSSVHTRTRVDTSPLR